MMDLQQVLIQLFEKLILEKILVELNLLLVFIFKKKNEFLLQVLGGMFFLSFFLDNASKIG